MELGFEAIIRFLNDLKKLEMKAIFQKVCEEQF